MSFGSGKSFFLLQGVMKLSFLTQCDESLGVVKGLLILLTRQIFSRESLLLFHVILWLCVWLASCLQRGSWTTDP
jgi:hypothetical protein